MASAWLLLTVLLIAPWLAVAGMDTDEQSLSLERKFGRGQALVHTALSEYVSTPLKERSLDLKERHEAREERDGTEDGAGADHAGPRRRRNRGQPKAEAKFG